MRSSLLISLVLSAAACGGVEPSNVPGLVDFPSPREMERHDSVEALVSSVCVHGLPAAASEKAFELLAERGLVVGAQCGWAVTFTRDELEHAEEYTVTTRIDGGSAATTIAFSSDRAALYAWMTALVNTRVETGGVMVPEMTVRDWPSFPRRGVVEGTYGIPFSTGERATLLRVLGSLRENTYIYSPKQDPFCRELWGSDYPSTSLMGPNKDTIRSAVAESRRHLIDFVWGISPGLSYDFARHDEEFPKLVRKIDHLRSLGVTRFALFLDDIPSNDAPAHARLINALLQHLQAVDEKAHLIVVGATYAGDADGYTRTLGNMVDPGVEVLWTGKDVVSKSISPGDLAGVNEALKRDVGIWDNWPRERFAFRNRSADLPVVTQGFYSNPVITEFNLHPPEEFIAVVGPIADYLWNSERYASTENYADQSFERWLKLVAP